MAATPDKKEKYVARLAHLEKDRAHFASKMETSPRAAEKLAVCEKKIADVKDLIAQCDAAAEKAAAEEKAEAK